MSSEPLPYDGSYLWGIAAKKKGTLQMVSMPRTFGVASTPEEAFSRLEKECILNPSFLTKWKGYQFIACLTNYYVEVPELGGAIVRHKNDRQLVRKT